MEKIIGLTEPKPESNAGKLSLVDGNNMALGGTSKNITKLHVGVYHKTILCTKVRPNEMWQGHGPRDDKQTMRVVLTLPYLIGSHLSINKIGMQVCYVCLSGRKISIN